MKQRDSQKSKVYDAEDAVPRGNTLPEIANVRRYIKRAFSMRRVQNRFPFLSRELINQIEIHDGGGRRSACASNYRMSFPKFARNELFVCHEMAHTVDGHERKRLLFQLRERSHELNIPGRWQVHGWRFCQIYLDLVLLCMGRETHDQLKAAFKAKRVRIRPKRALNAERRAELAARLAVLRGRQAQGHMGGSRICTESYCSTKMATS